MPYILLFSHLDLKSSVDKIFKLYQTSTKIQQKHDFLQLRKTVVRYLFYWFADKGQRLPETGKYILINYVIVAGTHDAQARVGYFTLPTFS